MKIKIIRISREINAETSRILLNGVFISACGMAAGFSSGLAFVVLSGAANGTSSSRISTGSVVDPSSVPAVVSAVADGAAGVVGVDGTATTVPSF